MELLTPAGEHSPGVADIPDVLPEPHLAIRVNGVKIAARGGSWGMDDALKRIPRDHLEPYFRLEREAHMNIVRNWMGTNTEPQFYDLADENGMMVLNDFWQSTQNFQVEPQDPQLFVANARDAIARYRNHPSIVVWFGRNEGVPYPMLNEGLDDAVAELDGTRWYTGSSNTHQPAGLRTRITTVRQSAISRISPPDFRSKPGRLRCRRLNRYQATCPPGPLAAVGRARLSRLALQRERRQQDLHGRAGHDVRRWHEL